MSAFSVAQPISKRGMRLIKQNPGLKDRIIDELIIGNKTSIEVILDERKARLRK